MSPDNISTTDATQDRMLSEVQRLDAEDELAAFRAEFYLDPEQVYLDGNSLGPLSKSGEAAVHLVLDAWKRLRVEGWTEAEPAWFTLAETLGKRTAPLIGASPDSVIVTNSTTVNLHQLVATLFNPETFNSDRLNTDNRRNCILTDALGFPSDLYALQSQLRLRGLEPERRLIRAASGDGAILQETDIAAAMTAEVQMTVLPAVVYTSGQLLDMAYLTDQAHQRGILIGFDCSHSIGAVPHELDRLGVDFAFWCGYKYLNGGPGAAGGLYLNRRHFNSLPGLAGWFGSRKERQFDMAPDMEPAVCAGAMQIGTPNILSMAPLTGTLEQFERAGIHRLRAKSLALTRLLMQLIETELDGYGFTIINPREDDRRGGHVALRHSDAMRICRALRAEGVIADHRPPDILRLAPVALYTTFTDCVTAVARLRHVMEKRTYNDYQTERELVP